MSGTKTISPAVDSPNSFDRVSNRESEIDAMESGFFDGMLTFGWLAARDGEDPKEMTLTVIEVNDALRFWLGANNLSDVLDDIDKKGVEVEHFLQRILHDEHSKVGQIVEGNLEWVTGKVEELTYDKVISGDGQWLKDEPEGQYTVQRTIRFVNDKEDSNRLTKVLAGVRVIAPGAIRLRSNNERDRVDLVSACQIEKKDSKWHVVRYQGLLQQAWLRVKGTIKVGTQAGTVGLVSRNMSHNIGSHALFYLEMDECDKEKRIFFRYMRERMELLAGFATSMPLSSAPGRLSVVIEDFKKNTALLKRIAKSERIDNIEILFEGEDREIALPGGVLSAQALYAIFENNIRDSAKHGRTRGSAQGDLKLKIAASDAETEFKEDFIKIVVSDNRNNYKDAGEQLKTSLNDLRIVDETGRLESGDWGIKERFISAALLRGRRLEDIEIQLQGDREQTIKYFIGDHAPEGEPRILDVTNVDGNLGWIFYLLKPKDILLIGKNFKDALPPELKEKFGDTIDGHDFDWLKTKVTEPSKVRHRFVVVCVDQKNELLELEALRDKLPYRVIVRLPKGLELSDASRFAAISESNLDLAKLSLDRLYRRWVDWLLDYPPKSLLEKTARWMRWLVRSDSKNAEKPEILFSDAGFKALTLNESTGMFHWTLDDTKDYQTKRAVLLFDRHGSCMQNQVTKKKEEVYYGLQWNTTGQRFSDTVTHYEPYLANDALFTFSNAAIGQIRRRSLHEPLQPSALGFSFLEAGLTKILIVDERIDPTSETQMSYHPDPRIWECSLKELFKWKGIDIKGKEYARDEIPGPKQLVKWVDQQNYDFLVLHKGIVDKLVKLENKNNKKDPKELMRNLFDDLRKHVRHIIIHSGRMAAAELPDGVKFMSLSNVDSWLKDNRPKIQIVEDLYLLRRP